MSESDPFIPAGTNVGPGSPSLGHFANLSRDAVRDRWKTVKGREMLTAWTASGFDREKLGGLLGTFYDHFDLRGIPLSGRDLKKKNLSKIDFFQADLSKADLSQADLSETHVSEADIRGAKLDWAKTDRLLLDNVRYDARTSFLGVDLNSINFTLAALLRDLALTQQRIDHLKSRNPILAAFLRMTSEYGLSLGRFFLWTGLVIAIFAVLFAVVPGAITKGGFWNALYFSVVTFTTLGYGDITPSSPIGQLFAMIEVALGYLMGGLLVAILARRMLLG